ncbi:MAG TPA: hypothetical protein VFY29_19020 [Terriglobia bacterium]|nr:hypothetical protein [Terriglobia bacterium]
MVGILSALLFLTGLQPALQTGSGFNVSGRVVRSAAVPATAAARIVLTETNNAAAPAEATVGADGSFRFSAVQPGTYRAQPSAGSADWVAEPLNVVVVDHDVSGVQIVINAMVPVLWDVKVETDGLRPSVTMQLVPYRGGSGARSIALGDAETSRPVAEGEYRVSWAPLPAGYEMKSVLAGSVDALASRLKVAGGGAPLRVTVTLGVSDPPPWVKVAGRVLSLSASPLPAGVGIVLEDSSTLKLTPEARASVDGSFEFPRVLPGSYRPMLTGAQDLQIMSPVTLVVPNTDLTGIRVAVTPLKQITGKVILEGTQPIPYPSLVVIAVNRFQTSFRPQPDGTFTVSLPVGSSPTRLIAPGFRLRSFVYGASNLLEEPLTVGANDAAEFRVTLSPENLTDDFK